MSSRCPGVPLSLHSRARSLGEVTHTRGHDVILHVVLHTGLIMHCCILNAEVEHSPPATEPRIRLADRLVGDPPLHLPQLSLFLPVEIEWKQPCRV